MAARLNGAGGSVDIGDVYVDFNSWNLRAQQTGVTQFTLYGTVDTTMPYVDNVGSGVLLFNLEARGFLVRDAADEDVAPGISTDLSMRPNGESVTLYAHPKCSYSGVFLIDSVNISHHVRAGVVPVVYTGLNRETVTESWQLG